MSEADLPDYELKPFKIIGQLIGARYDREGEIVGEEVMGELVIYRPQFAETDDLINDAIISARSENY